LVLSVSGQPSNFVDEIWDPTRAEFAIGSKGEVTSAQLGDSELPDAVGRCMVTAVERWTFPKPRGGGVVAVVFPVELTPG
jgi:hypothetical protein